MNEHLVHDTEPTARPAAVRMRPALLIAAGVAVIGLVGFAGWFANGDTLVLVTAPGRARMVPLTAMAAPI
jgi:hypothetical protein